MNKRSRIPDIFAFLILLVILSVLPSCENDPVGIEVSGPSWVQTGGPCGGGILTISISPEGHIFAGVWRKIGYHYHGDGFYRSVDDCASWVDLGLEAGMGFSVFSSGIDSHGRIFIYSGGAIPTGSGLYRSLDDGKTWTYTGTDEMDQFVVASLVMNAHDHIFAVARRYYPEGDTGGIFRSTDNGDSWTKVTDFEAGILAINSEGHLFAVAADEAIYTSTDNGDNWTLIPGSMAIPMMTSMAIDLNDHIYVGTFEAGIFRSIDNGENWMRLTNGLGSDPIFPISFNEGGDIFAGSDGCIFRSTDNGDSWTRLSDDILDSIVFCITVDPDGDIYAGTGDDGMLRSTDNGDNWEIVGAPIANVDYLVISSDDHIFAGTDFGLFRSLDNGDNWKKLDFEAAIRAISSDGVLFASGENDEISGFWRSIDDGDSWVLVDDTAYFHIAINSGGVLFGCTGNSVFRSMDSGESWEQVSDGLTDAWIVDITIDINDHIFVSSFDLPPPPPPTVDSEGVDGIFRSTNNGDSWTFIAGPGGALTINDSGDMFVYGDAIYRSTNQGVDWDLVDDAYSVTNLVISSIGNLYASTSYEGILCSRDNGDTWKPLNEGLTARFGLAIDSRDVLFAGNWNRGVYRLVENEDVYYNSPRVCRF